MTEPTLTSWTAPAVVRPHQPVSGRRALLAHGVWEAVLAVVAVVLVAFLLISHDSNRLLPNLLAAIGTSGLVASALSLSLRTATPNLSVGSLAVVASVISARLTADGRPFVVALLLAVLATTVIGLVTGVVVALLSVPAWAATLAAAAIADAVVLGTTDAQLVAATGIELAEWLWFALFVLVTLAGGALWLVPAVRAGLGGSRGAAAVTGRWAGLKPGLGALVGLTGSGLLAGVAGAALTTRLHASMSPGTSLSLTISALAVVALGGVSVFGRRGGVTGTLFATVLLVTVGQLLALEATPYWVQALVIGLALLVGLAVTRFIESISGPVPLDSAPAAAQPAPLPASPAPVQPGQD
ncbi:ABC transporter permease subunit [Catellatospora tritici]|uniref:ABC transporter permease subunit n=1 Tax=Catellatospora tritici TaxID=2851566 RepID=UPI001C2CEBE4|nr:hypothetical protein [Catellatospora tritici]MBV1853567.1 hypothetical protein [Catellatospora tritici]